MDEKEILIRSATVVTGDGLHEADVLIRGEAVASVQPRGAVSGGADGQATRDGAGDRIELIDAAGLWLLPGGVDAHVHFGMPLRPGVTSLGWRESSEAALLGGTTTVIDFANPVPEEPITAAVDRWLADALGTCLCDFGLHATVSLADRDHLAELPALVERGIPTFKGFLAYKGRLMLTAEEMARLMKSVAACGGRLLVHAEDGELNARAEAVLMHTGRSGPEWHPTAHPPESEVAAVETALSLARSTHCPLTLVHLSLAESLQRLRQARRAAAIAGAAEDLLTGEVCLHHIFASSGCCDGSYEAALRVVLSPPIRSVQDSAALLAGLAAGDIDLLSTDHCEFPLAIKLQAAHAGFPAIPNGAGGVGERLTWAYARGVVPGDLTPERWVRVCCERPAELMGLGRRKGRIAPGFDADLVLFDPRAEQVWRPLGESDPQSSLYAGVRVTGMVRRVWLRGRLVVDGGRLIPDAAPGCFLSRRLV
jgi:dihydropyrimidinase